MQPDLTHSKGKGTDVSHADVMRTMNTSQHDPIKKSAYTSSYVSVRILQGYGFFLSFVGQRKGFSPTKNFFVHLQKSILAIAVN